MLCAPKDNTDVTHSTVAGNVTEAQPGTTGPPTPSVKLTVPKLGTGPAATPDRPAAPLCVAYTRPRTRARCGAWLRRARGRVRATERGNYAPADASVLQSFVLHGDRVDCDAVSQ